jgi:hypothetical protein
VAAAAGIREWKAVSKQATAGTRGIRTRTAAIPASEAGMWSGAKSVIVARYLMTSESMRTDCG